MNAIVIVVVVVVAFLFGSKYGKTHYRHRKNYLLCSLITLFASVFSVFALVGLLAFISPMLFVNVVAKLPTDIQNMIFVDLFLRGGTGVWVFMILSGVLWWVRTKKMKCRW